MWAKDANGKWRDAFDATEWGGPFTEGSSWHWTWSVLHDPEGLSRLMGGHTAMEARLDSMFTAPNTCLLYTSIAGLCHQCLVGAFVCSYAEGR